MPFGIPTKQYVTAMLTYMAVALSGSSLVFQRYKPMDGYEKEVEEEKDKLRQEFLRFCEKRATNDK